MRQMTSVNKTLTRRPALQRKFAAVIEPVDVVAVETFIAHLHPGAERAHGWKVLYCETDRLCRCRKTAIAERLARPTFALRHEQFGWRAVIELHRLAFVVTMRD
jgi:hypothetical protein